MKNQRIFEDDQLLSKLVSLTDDDNTLHLLFKEKNDMKTLWTMNTRHLSTDNIEMLIDEKNIVVFANMTGKQLLENMTSHDKAQRMFWHEELDWLTEKMAEYSQTKIRVHNFEEIGS